MSQIMDAITTRIVYRGTNRDKPPLLMHAGYDVDYDLNRELVTVATSVTLGTKQTMRASVYRDLRLFHSAPALVEMRADAVRKIRHALYGDSLNHWNVIRDALYQSGAIISPRVTEAFYAINREMRG